MPIENPPGFVQAGSYTARADRLHNISTRFQPSLSQTFSLAARGGLLPNGTRDASYIVSNGGVGWDLVVGPFTWVVENDFATNAGDYLVVKNGNDTLTLTPSSATTNRVDTIAVQVVDAFYSGSATEGRLVVIQGTPTTGTPAAPALPPSCEPIFDARVLAGSTAPVLVDRRRRTGGLGTVVPIFGDQFLDAGRFPGETQYYDVLGTYRTWHAGSTNAWRAFGGQLARNGSQLRTTGTLNDGQQHNIAQVLLQDPGGIWSAQATMQAELSFTGGGRCDLVTAMDAADGSNLFGTGIPFVGWPHAVGQAILAAALSGVLTGQHTVWFNIIRTFGGNGATYTFTPFNFRATAVQFLLRAP